MAPYSFQRLPRNWFEFDTAISVMKLVCDWFNSDVVKGWVCSKDIIIGGSARMCHEGLPLRTQVCITGSVWPDCDDLEGTDELSPCWG